MIKLLIRDEAGFLISAELVLIFTLMFCGVAVGMGVIRDSLVQELGDVAEAIGALNQSYSFNTLEAPGADTPSGLHVSCSGSGFADQKDDCDCEGIEFEQIRPKDDPNNPRRRGAAEGR
ncbi:MAG: hypothetical protein O2820_12940 [Planctomycetota bacterium]|nr:hypothetical protein [Planctomycetota bacterium]MDA1250119.1 hypothetical protein [Planctomycetota bacterium]